jgi:transcriptional regulator with XRE-family HTH domain
MQSFHLKYISLLLSLQPVHIKVARIPYPPHWKPGQRVSKPPQSLGDRIRKHRLELHWLQARLAKAIGVSIVSVSNWERGACLPSRRMMKRIQGFIDYTSRPVPEHPTAGLCGWECRMDETAGQLCLFEKICTQLKCDDFEQQVTGQEVPSAAKHSHAPLFRHNQQPMREA